MKKYLLVAAIALWSSQAVAADSLLAPATAPPCAHALAMLGRLNAAELPPDEGRTADQYRALCLLALGKTAEASLAIESVVAAEPLYHPDADVSPRVRAVFTDVRKRLLPGLVQQKYAIAKTAYDHKDFRAASAGFGLLITRLSFVP